MLNNTDLDMIIPNYICDNIKLHINTLVNIGLLQTNALIKIQGPFLN